MPSLLRFALLGLLALASALAESSDSRRELLALQRRRLVERSDKLKDCFKGFNTDVLVKASTSAGIPPTKLKASTGRGSMSTKEAQAKLKQPRADFRKGSQKSTCNAMDLITKKTKSTVDCTLNKFKNDPLCAAVVDNSTPCTDIDCRPQCYEGGLVATNATRRMLVDSDDTEEIDLDSEDSDEVMLQVAAQVSDEEADDLCGMLADPGFKSATLNYRATRRPTTAARRQMAEEANAAMNRRRMATPDFLSTAGVQNMAIECEANGLCHPGKAPYDANAKSWGVLNENIANQGYLNRANANWQDLRTDTNRGYNQVIGCRVLEVIAFAVDAGCNLAGAFGVTVSGGFIVEGGTHIEPGVVICTVILAVAEGATTWCKYSSEDADWHDGIINSYEIMGSYENTIVIGENQLRSQNLTGTAITIAKTEIMTANNDNFVAVATKADANANLIVTTAVDARNTVTTHVTTEHTTTRLQLTNFQDDVDQKYIDLNTKLEAFIQQFATLFQTLTNLINKQFTDQNAELKRRLDIVNEAICTVKDQLALLHREINYVRVLLTMPDGRRPGFDPNPPKDSPAFMPCSDPRANGCRAGPRDLITAWLPSWTCFVPGRLAL